MKVESILKGHVLFSKFSIEEVNRISGFSERRKYRKNDLIFDHGEKADHVFVLLQGSVFLHLPAKLEEFRIVISKVETGDLFGMSSLLGSEYYLMEAKCAEPADVLVINAKKLRNLLETDCMVGFIIMNEVALTYLNRYFEILNRLQGIVIQIPLITNV
ncbi:MAG: cyclic nucleotide-binding domain-containing protein [Deltaproteobacteria bacterium]|nr:cyclic nucleotide-binding domain-containing protein [Deltaproteobacteria bacterium]